MKKAILFATFILFSLLSFAKPAEAIYVKVTFTITSVTVPVRAVAALTPLPPTTEMAILGSGVAQMEIIRNSDQVTVSQKGGPLAYFRRSTVGAPGASTWSIVFQNDGGSYTPRIKVTSNGLSTNIAYIDCSGTSPVSTYYVIVYKESLTNVDCPVGGSNMVSPQYLKFNFPTI